jgi:hypothetical protein
MLAFTIVKGLLRLGHECLLARYPTTAGRKAEAHWLAALQTADG